MTTKITIPGANFISSGLPKVGQKFDVADISELSESWIAASEFLQLSGNDVVSWAGISDSFELNDAGYASARPVFEPTGWDGSRGCLTFSGAVDGPALKNNDGPFSQNQTMFFVIERTVGVNDDSASSYRPFVASAVADDSHFRMVGGLRPGADASQNSLSINGSGSEYPSYQDFPVSEKMIVMIAYGTGSVQFGKNGVLSVPESISEDPSPAGSYFSVGGQYSNAASAANIKCRKLACKIAEVCVFSDQLSDTDRIDVEGHLAWNWGLQAALPTNHKYKSVPPVKR